MARVEPRTRPIGRPALIRSLAAAIIGAAIPVALASTMLVADGCGPFGPSQIDESKAVQIARDFVVAAQPSDYQFVQLTNDTPQVVGDHWRVKVDAQVRIPSAPETGLHYIIDVNRATGAASIEAQG